MSKPVKRAVFTETEPVKNPLKYNGSLPGALIYIYLQAIWFNNSEPYYIIN